MQYIPSILVKHLAVGAWTVSLLCELVYNSAARFQLGSFVGCYTLLKCLLLHALCSWLIWWYLVHHDFSLICASPTLRLLFSHERRWRLPWQAVMDESSFVTVLDQPTRRGAPGLQLHTWQGGRSTLGMSLLISCPWNPQQLFSWGGGSQAHQCWLLEIVSFHSQKSICGPRMYRLDSTEISSVWFISHYVSPSYNEHCELQ